MVDPVTIAAIAGGGSVLQKVIGGIINSINARKQAEFNQKLLDEQIQVNNILYAREIRGKVGENLVEAAARGVAQSGSVIDSAFDEAFTMQLQRSAKNYALRVEQTKSGILGNQKGQSALLAGLAGALTGVQTTAKAVGTINATNDAKNDGTTTGTPQGPPAPSTSQGGTP